jgi:hypothetical protein
LVVAEYSCHDILSFTESWLKPDISTDSFKLPGYKPPYRINRVDRLGRVAVVFVKDEINCVTRLDLQVGSVDQGYKKIRLIRSLKKFIFRYQYLVEIYSVSAEKIISDAFSYSENV